MPLLSKQKRKLKEQTHTIDGKFDKKANKNSQQLIDNNSGDALNMEAELKIYQKIKKFWLGKTLKSTYYDKYDPSGSLTKAAAGTKKITNFFNNSDIQATNLQLFNQDTLNDILSDTDSNLKEQLEKQHNQLTVIEYNYKRAIFEYLTLLNNNNGCEKVDISLKYWLLNNKLPESRHGKYQKTIRVIDDEDVAERCHIWIRKQNFNTTPATFKKF
ncbi:2803_t:CDS:2, partial [Rhizophagus irregularis]